MLGKQHVSPSKNTTHQISKYHYVSLYLLDRMQSLKGIVLLRSTYVVGVHVCRDNALYDVFLSVIIRSYPCVVFDLKKLFDILVLPHRGVTFSTGDVDFLR